MRLHYIVLHCLVLYDIVLYYMRLHYIIAHYVVLYHIVLYYMRLHYSIPISVNLAARHPVSQPDSQPSSPKLGQTRLTPFFSNQNRVLVLFRSKQNRVSV
jgi:hypothetical protein